MNITTERVERPAPTAGEVLTGRIEGLDMLRGVAAVLVLLFHLRIANQFAEWPFSKAYLAVDFFFMLSGYVLTRTYHAQFGQGLTPDRFLRLRIGRLWPTIAFGGLLGLFAHLVDNPLDSQIAVLFAMTLAWVPLLTNTDTQIFRLNVVLWSILFEVFANVAHASVLWRMRSVGFACIVLGSGVLMIVGAHTLGDFDLGSFGSSFVFGFPRVLLSYSIGCWLFLRFRDRPLVGASSWIPSLLLCGAVLLGWAARSMGWSFDLLFVLFVCPVALLTGLNGLGRLSRTGAFLGALSFPLYATHVPVIQLVEKAGLHWAFAVPLALAAAYLAMLAGRHSKRVVTRAREMRARALQSRSNKVIVGK